MVEFMIDKCLHVRNGVPVLLHTNNNITYVRMYPYIYKGHIRGLEAFRIEDLRWAGRSDDAQPSRTHFPVSHGTFDMPPTPYANSYNAPPKIHRLTSSLPSSNRYASDILTGEFVNGCSLLGNMEGTACTPSASTLPNVNGTPNESQRSSTSNFAFLIHSQESLNMNLPPNVDNKKAVRQAQRRRRTRWAPVVAKWIDLLPTCLSAPRTMQFSKRNMQKIPNLRKQPGWR